MKPLPAEDREPLQAIPSIAEQPPEVEMPPRQDRADPRDTESTTESGLPTVSPSETETEVPKVAPPLTDRQLPS